MKTILQQFISETIKASPAYMKKEKVRQQMQDHVVELVKQGEISTPEELEKHFENVKMSLDALKMVPLDVYQKLAGV